MTKSRRYLSCIFAGLAVPVLALVSACSDAGLFLPVEDPAPEITVRSVPSGTVLGAEDVVDVSMDYDSSEVFPDRLVLTVLSSIGEVVYMEELDESAVQQLPVPVPLPETLEPGKYTFVVTAYHLEEELVSRESVFFLVDGRYSIGQISTYPQILFPGGDGLLSAAVEYPAEADPYLVWSADGEIFFQGYVSEGADLVQITAPELEGVHRFTLELFPMGPGPGEADSFPFMSSIYVEAQYFVSEQQDLDPYEFAPENQYYSLFHFRGEMSDYGTREANDPAAPIGDVNLAISESIFGYFTDGTNGFSVEGSVVPISDGILEPFSLSLRLLVLTGRANDYLVRVSEVGDEHADPYVTMGFDERENAYIDVDGARSTLPADLLTPNQTEELTVSVIPGNGSLEVLWYVSGEFLHATSVAWSSVEREGPFETAVAGPGGFSGILDEVGVRYSKQGDLVEVDSDVFARAMRLELGGDLVFAEGFDGLQPPDTLVYEVGDEPIEIGSSSLRLPPGSRITTEAVSLEAESVTITVDADTDSPASVLIEIIGEESSQIVFTYAGNGVVTFPDGSTAGEQMPDGLHVNIVRDEKHVLLVAGVVEERIEDYLGEEIRIKVAVANTSTDAFLTLNSLLITKNQYSSS